MSVFQRLEMLYRPSYSRQGLATVPRHRNNTEVVLTNFTNNSGNSGNSSSGNTAAAPADPPPKYTPPPSYSTATGARIARMLRQSFRRSVRRLAGAGAGQGAGSKAAAPPDYAHVIIESRPAGAAQLAAEEVYLEPRDSIIFEMRPTAADIFHADTVLAASHYSLDLSLPTLQRRSVRRNSSHRQQQQQQQPPGRVLAVGVGSLHRADSEAVLVEAAEPINVDSDAASELQLYSDTASLDSDAVTLELELACSSDEAAADSDYDAGDCERLRSSAEMEAVNMHVWQLSSRSGGGHVVTIDMDTYTSVI